ncbi:MAG: type II toxin-antitoxin system Phd/YefM family antitoxin [Caldilineaceae bacterium]
MQTIMVTSDHARIHWQETIDAAFTEKNEIVIEQQGKPVATLVNYALFEEMKRELLLLHGLQNAERNRQERMEHPSSTVTLTDLIAKLNLAEQPAITSTKTLPTSKN